MTLADDIRALTRRIERRLASCQPFDADEQTAAEVLLHVLDAATDPSPAID